MPTKHTILMLVGLTTPIGLGCQAEPSANGVDLIDSITRPTRRAHAMAIVLGQDAGRNLSTTYVPETDTISVLKTDIVDRSPRQLVSGEKGVGIGVVAAQTVAEQCVTELAALGAVPPGTYSQIPIRTAERVTVIGERSWVEQYDFVFAPLDIRVGVSAQSGRCRSMTMRAR